MSPKTISLVKRNVEDEIDGLFRLPLADFTSARNALAARLKKEGRPNEAERVKLLGKPSVSAWAVNQLYWEHRAAFDQLIASGKRLRPTQRDSLDARREALVQLADLATDLLQNAGHNPSLETMRRVTTTLEALSAHALLSDGPTPGRLINDVDPPGFASLASLMTGSGAKEPIKSGGATTKQAIIADERKIHQAKIGAAKALLQDAKRSLTEARARAESLASAQKKASAEAKEAEKHKREADQRLEKATAASRDAAQALQDAKHTLAEATKELESLLRE
jgi:hypothetical protein